MPKKIIRMHIHTNLSPVIPRSLMQKSLWTKLQEDMWACGVHMCCFLFLASSSFFGLFIRGYLVAGVFSSKMVG